LNFFGHLIDSGLISTVDPMTKKFQLLLEIFWAVIENFSCQLGQRKTFGEKFQSPNQANYLGNG
jgi:hypothetical protein